MSKNFFKVRRPGVNTTYQDLGRENLYHIGIPFSGAMDNRNFLISNKLVGNLLNMPVIEFAYQGPLLKYYGEKLNFAITGDVTFTLKKNNKIIAFATSSTKTGWNFVDLDITGKKGEIFVISENCPKKLSPLP